MMSEPTQDRDRVLAEARVEYERRDSVVARNGKPVRPEDMIIRVRTARQYANALQACGLLPIGERAVLDVGCGDGNFLLRCRDEWGQQEAPLCGIDLMVNRIERLKRQASYLDVRAGSADQLPWEDNTFDLVHQSMLLTSVLDESLRRGIAAEMRRVTRNGGHVLWYDFIWNPVNKAAVGLSLRRVRSCFPGWVVAHRRRTTLPPPIARRLLRISETLVAAVEALTIFNSFELLLLRKPSEGESKP